MAKTFRYAGYAVANGYDVPLLTLFNGDDFGSGRKITVLSASVRPTKPSRTAGFGKFATRRITAASGGDSVQVTKFDTANASLPSQVDIKIGADVTNGSELFGTIINLPLSPSPFATRALGWRYNLSTWWATSRSEGSTQHIKLAAGEGISVAQLDDLPHPSGVWQLLCIIKIGTEYHNVDTAFYAREAPTSCFSIMNNTGSGVTVEVVSLEINEIGAATITTPAADAPYISYKRVEGYLGGEEVTPLAMDTGDTLPASIKLVRNRLFLDMVHYEVGSKSGSPSKYAYGYPSSNMIIARSAGMLRQTLTHIADNMYPGDLSFPASGFKPRVQDFDIVGKVDAFQGLVLNPGEGFSVQSMNITHYAAYYIEIEFTHTPPVAAGGGLKAVVTVT